MFIDMFIEMLSVIGITSTNTSKREVFFFKSDRLKMFDIKQAKNATIYQVH